MAKRRRSAPSPPQGAASVDPTPHPDSQQQRYDTVGLHSLPVELARRILLLLHPVDLISISSISRDVRKLFRPADSDVQFAAKHLSAHFPELRNDISDNDSDSDSCDSDSYSTDSDDSDNSDVSDDSDDSDDDEAFKNLCLRLRRKVGGRFRSLPLCYALAVFKMKDFDERIINAMIYKKKRLGEKTEAEKRRDRMFIERLLFTGVFEVELGFEEAEYEWEGRWYRRKEAYDEVRWCIGMAGSIEAARRVIEIEKNSVTVLPLGYIGEKESDRENRSLLDDPNDVSESIRGIAYEACVEGTVLLLRFLLDTYPASFSNLATQIVNEATYLQTAFSCYQEEVIKTLVDYMRRPPYCQEPAVYSAQKYNPALSSLDPNSGASFLQSAASDGDEPMVRLLLGLGADPNFVPSSTECNCIVGRFDDRRSYCNSTPFSALHIACDRRHDKLIPLLVGHGADPMWRNAYGATALLTCRHSKTATALLEAVKLHQPHVLHGLLAAQSSNGLNALHQAISEENCKLLGVVVKTIAKVGCDEASSALMNTVFAARDRFGKAPISMAIRMGDFCCKKVLDTIFDECHEGTFNAMREILMFDDGNGYTPVHVAAKRTHARIASLRKMLQVLSSVDDGMCEKILSVKAGRDRRTPLHFAARMGHSECVQMLLEHGALRGMKDRMGKTALMIARRFDRVDVVPLLQRINPVAKEASAQPHLHVKRRGSKMMYA
ncbi:hypothetical protein HDU96_003969 [Phlyctochytrium bullatum]|nr:hypothetical protein HDU96_003969 [Phlyctochytrium bullatum]